MTREARFDRQLPAILEDLYLGPSPDYRDEVLAAATDRRQRPAWAFPGRWIPMAEYTARLNVARRVPMRTIGVALVIIALIVAGVAIYVGSRPRLPAPFGPARNGQVLSVPENGINLYAIDPTTGGRTLLIAGTGPEGRSFGSAVYTPDGTHIAFESHDWTSYRIYIAKADGSGALLITPNALFDPRDWHVAPDGRSVLVLSSINERPSMSLAMTDGSGMNVLDVGSLSVFSASFRSDDASQILFVGGPDQEGNELGLYLRAGDGTVHTLVAPDADAPIWEGSFSPDGTTIAYFRNLRGQDATRVYVARVDPSGNGIGASTVIGHDPRAIGEAWPLWSPDGRRLLIERTMAGSAALPAVTTPVVISADGKYEVRIHDTIAGNGANKAWSPDGTLIQVRQVDDLGHELPQTIWDPENGDARPAPWDATSIPSWQRLAP